MTQEFGNGIKVRYLGPYPLTAFDLRVLQGLVALAGPRGHRMSEPELDDQVARQRRALLEAAAPSVMVQADAGETLYIHESFARLAAEIGMRAQKVSTQPDGHYGGAYVGPIRSSLERLFATSIIVDDHGERAGFRLISKLATSQRRSELWVLLNPRLSAAVVGGPHARIDMDEIRALQSDAGRLLHQRLCALIFPGETRTFLIETMVRWIYTADKVGDRARRKRATTVEDAMTEIQRLGWAVTLGERGSPAATISRPLRHCHMPPRPATTATAPASSCTASAVQPAASSGDVRQDSLDF